MAVDVLHHHDGIVDQNPDRKHQRKQADPIERVAKEIRGRQGQSEGHGDDDRHHRCLSPRQRDPHQKDDGEGGRPQMLEKLIGLFVGGGPVVAGLEDFDVRGQYRAAQPLDHPVEVRDHVDRVGAGFLGDGDGHCCGIDAGVREVLFGRRGTRAKPHVGGGLLGAIRYVGDVRQVNRPAPGGRNDEPRHIVAIVQKLTDIHNDLGIGNGGRACRQTPVEGLQGLEGLQD